MARNTLMNIATGTAGIIGIVVGVNNISRTYSNAEELRGRGDNTTVEHVAHFLGDQTSLLYDVISPPDHIAEVNTTKTDKVADTLAKLAEMNLILTIAGTVVLVGSVNSLKK